MFGTFLEPRGSRFICRLNVLCFSRKNCISSVLAKLLAFFYNTERSANFSVHYLYSNNLFGALIGDKKCIYMISTPNVFYVT